MLYYAKEALKNKEYKSGLVFINFGHLAFAKALADWEAPDTLPDDFFDRKVLPKREKT